MLRAHHTITLLYHTPFHGLIESLGLWHVSADAAHMAGGSGYAAGESLYDTWVRNNSLYPTGGIAIQAKYD